MVNNQERTMEIIKSAIRINKELDKIQKIKDEIKEETKKELEKIEDPELLIITGINHSENQTIQAILQAFTNSPQKELTYQDIRNHIKLEIPDTTVDKMLIRMKKEGDIFESKQGVYQRI